MDNRGAAVPQQTTFIHQPVMEKNIYYHVTNSAALSKELLHYL